MTLLVLGLAVLAAGAATTEGDLLRVFHDLLPSVVNLLHELSHPLGYGYDGYGNRNSVTDPLSDKITYGFDSVSRLTSMVSPRGNVSGGNPAQYTTTYSPKARGQPLTVTETPSATRP